MLIQPGRIFAATKAEAIKSIRAKYGTGELIIYPANVQPRKNLIWFEFYIELPEPH
jgi:flagellar biosynthesis GTPase FlhF